MFGGTEGHVMSATHIHNYQQMLSTSKFCLAPAGWGWGGRLKAAVLHGCVPVIVQVRASGQLLAARSDVPLAP